MEEPAEKKEEVKESPKKQIDITEKVRGNPWILATFVCGALAMILLIVTLSGGITGNAISSDDAAKKLLSFYEENGATNLTLNSVKEVSGLYQVNLDYKGEIYPFYMTKDGKNLITGESLIPLEPLSSSSETEQEEVPKTDKPKVELYVFTYCPYGTQMEKAMIPAIKLFGDKIDFKIRQIGAMHGEYEEIEAKRQLCIEKEYPDKFLNYVLKFAEDKSCIISESNPSYNGDEKCLATKINNLFSNLGIDASKINSCMDSDGDKLYDAEVANANANDVSGSPTLIINGVEVSSGRSPEAVKGVICNAFNTVPTECGMTLGTEQAAAGFGSGTSSSSSTASC